MTIPRFFRLRLRRRLQRGRLARLSPRRLALLVLVPLVVWGPASAAVPTRMLAPTRAVVLSRSAVPAGELPRRGPLDTRAGQPDEEDTLAGSSRAAPGVRITATAAVLMDARSGRILFSRNAHRLWPPASTTKIMTALLALESTPLDAEIPISRGVARFRDGTVVGLPEGARIPLHDLLYGLMLPSGNDVALAIAEGVSGTVNAFVARMNDEARRLGATQTHFTSPHGLYDRDHYTTAYDLALITRVAMQNPTFREIVRTRRWVFAAPGGRARLLWNHNRLLSRYPGADGVKTGYVHRSGHTLVASATRNGLPLIAVLLDSRDVWGDASRLLTYGFAHYRSVKFARTGEELAAIALPGSHEILLGVVPDDVYGALPPDDVAVRRVSLRPGLALPVRQGDQVGQVEFYASGRLVGSAPLVAAHDVDSTTGMIERVVEWVGRMVTRLSSGVVL